MEIEFKGNDIGIRLKNRGLNDNHIIIEIIFDEGFNKWKKIYNSFAKNS
jgi:hypothetical protein